MANEFKVKNGLIVVGDLTTSGTITINGALAATQSWVSSQSYLTSANLSSYATQSYVTSAIASLVNSAPAALDTLNELAAALGNDASFSTTVTNSIASKLSLSGGTMTGQILFQTASLTNGFRWNVNSDAAGITFKNTGDGDNNSYFNFFTEDNGNEYFKFSHNTWNIGSFDFMDVKNGVVRTNGDIYVNASQSGTRSAGTNELINGSRVWHSGDFSSTNISNWNTAYSWGNHAGLYAASSHTHSATDITSGTISSARLSGSYAIDISGLSSSSNTLTREDNRTISPSELAAGQLKFGFTSWTNDNGGPYADFLHLRSYTDASGGDDNLVMFKKSGIGMRIWQQTWGSTTPYSSYADVWTTVNFTQTNVNNWNTSYGWGNHASAGYVSTSGSYANPSWITSLAYSKITGVPAFLTAESDTLNSVATRGNTTGNAITAGGLNSTADYSLQVDSGSTNVRMGRFKFIRSTYNPTGVSASIDFWRGGSAYEGMLAFSTNGGTIGDTSVERMRITDTGNVGIGTSNPSVKLDVAGNASFGASQLFKITDNGSGNFVLGGATVNTYIDGVTFRVRNSTGDVTVYADGTTNRVGIGTTSPSQKLEVNGNIGVPYTGYLISTTDTGNSIQLHNGSGVMNFYTNGSIRLSVAYSSGNVGIGTTSPTAPLDTNGVRLGRNWAIANRANIRLDSNGPDYPADILFGHTAAANQTSWDGVYWSISSRASSLSNAFTIWRGAGNPGGGSEEILFTILPNGNVGIGTSTPQVKLDVNGALGIVGSNFIYFGHTTGNIGAWTTRQYSSGSTHKFNAQTFVFNNEGYGSYEHMALTANGLNLRAKNTIDSTDSWLRLNQSGDYGSGVYTPGLMRADGGFYVSGSTVWHASNDGSGSGLDADLLDGNHASYFINTSNIGSQSVSYASSSGSATNSTNTYRAFIEDTRAAERTPSDYDDYKVSWEFTNQIPGLNYSGTSWWSAMTMQGWHNGYSAWQIIGSASSAIDDFYLRAGNNTTWNTARRIWHSGDFTSTNVSNWNTAFGWGNHASAGYATTSYVTTQINNLIAGAPGVLDTLDELAAALGDDSNFATTVTNSIAGKVSKSGDTITGNLNVVGNIYSTTSLGVILNSADAPLITRGWDSFTSGAYNGVGRWGLFMEPSTLVLGTPNIAGNGQVAFRRFNADGTSVTTLLVNSVGTTIYGNLTVGGTITENSSIKLKENVETSEGNLEKVVNLRPVTYNKIGSETTELGLIAEEVAQVYPEFVQYDENGEPIGVHYSRLTAALIGAVKQLTKRIETLENNG